MVVDGKPGPASDEIYSLPEFSPDDLHVEYVIREHTTVRMVFDGQPGDPYDKIDLGMFSSDSKHFAYSAQNGGKMSIVLDGKPQLAHRMVGFVVFSPDGKHFAYPAIDVQDKQVTEYMVVDGKADQTYDSVTIPSWSSGVLSYAATRGNVDYIVVNGVPQQILDRIIGAPLRYGGHLAYEVAIGPKDYVVLDSTADPLYDSIGSIAFSPDGSHFVYSAKKDGKWCEVIDRKPGPMYDAVTLSFESSFSADGQHWAYWATDGNKQFVVADGVAGPKYDVTPASSRLIFSQSGKHLTYVAQKGRQQILIVDGKEVAETPVNGLIPDLWFSVSERFVDFRDLPPFFTRDGKHVVWVMQQPDATMRVCVDGVSGPVYTLILCGPYLRPDGKVEYLAQGAKDWRETYRVIISFPSP
jgi:hypothetical protein